MDIGAQLPHAALRVYVMGERGARGDRRRLRTTAPWRHSLQTPCAPARSASRPHAPQPPHLDRRLHAALRPARRTDSDRRRDAQGRPQRAAIRAGPGSIHEDLPMMLRVAENTQCPISFSGHAG